MESNTRLPKPVMLALAGVFLFEAWFWGLCVALGRALMALLPWEAFKAAMRRFIDLLPAPAALLVFLIPVAIIEPIKTVCVVLMVHGHWCLGLLGFVVLKFVGLGLIAFVFDLTKHKLLTMPWFVVVYEKVMIYHDYAHTLVAPYKAAVIAWGHETRAWARAAWARARATWGRASA